jgi:hypothetical protein
MLICEEGIFIPKAHNTLIIPQITGTGSVVKGNQIDAKPSMYCTNSHHINHNLWKPIEIKKEKPTIATIKTIT